MNQNIQPNQERIFKVWSFLICAKHSLERPYSRSKKIVFDYKSVPDSSILKKNYHHYRLEMMLSSKHLKRAQGEYKSA